MVVLDKAQVNVMLSVGEIGLNIAWDGTNVARRNNLVKNWKFALLAVAIVLGVTTLFTSNAISVVAEAFCVVSVVVFAAAALFGLATKFSA